MIETITRVSNNTASLELVNKAIILGQELLQKPIELLDGVTETLESLKGKIQTGCFATKAICWIRSVN